MSNWVRVTHQGVSAVVNLDHVDAIMETDTGRSRLVWHRTLPRIEWTVEESFDEVVGRLGYVSPPARNERTPEERWLDDAI